MNSAPELKVRPSASDIWRTAITPRWLFALTALIAFIAVSVVLGRWQWDRTQDILAAERAAAAEPIQLSELINDDGTWNNADIGRTVILDGGFTGDEILIPNREYQGQSGTWTITRFELDNRASIAVVRGWLPNDEFSPPIRQEPTRIEGVLHPNEAFYEGANQEQIITVDAPALAAAWNTALIDGYVMLQEQDPVLLAADAAAPVIVPPTVSVGNAPFPLQNFFYAIQWWIFAVFAIFVYGRWLYLDARK
ncbi:MAG TPA: SURF1 family protein [Candidatus Nanopelagicales bacterium]|nr:SURF1 family protein [Candidatus Nanopelagicales bacterium]